jgi:hypothetical protein
MAISPSAASLEVAPLPLQPASPDDTPGISMEMSEAELRFEENSGTQGSGGLKIFSGNGNMSLALEIERHLGVKLERRKVCRRRSECGHS